MGGGEMGGIVSPLPPRERGEYGTFGRAALPLAVGLVRGLDRSTRRLIVTAGRVRRLAETRGWPVVLSERELAALQALASEKRRRDWLAGRLAAKLLVARTLAPALGTLLPLRDIEIGYDTDGAPRFTVAGRPGLESGWSISIAHCAGHGACAMAQTSRTGRVGVDLERARELRPELRRYFLSADELRRLGELPAGGPISPLALWTVKEAVIKAAPHATQRSMRNVHLSWDQTGRVSAAIIGPAARGVRIAAACERRGFWLLAYATCLPAGEG